MAVARPDKLAFGDVVIDFDGRRLVRGGIERPLEPKAFAVLALLAASPGRALTRDEILDAVWGHRHVTPGVLNRVVSLVRQALGDDAGGALHTVHGVGYRFELPSTADAVAGIAIDPHGATVGVTDAGADGAVVRGATRPGPRVVVTLVALALALVATAVVFASRHARTPPPGSATPTPTAGAATPADSAPSPVPAGAAPAVAPTLIVMPLKPIGTGSASKVIAEGLSEELICSLARVDGLRVIAQASTLLATADGGGSSGLIRRLGITHSLEGNLQQSGDDLRVRLRLVDATTGDTVWVKDFDRKAAEVLGLQRDVAREVAASLALRMGLDPDAAAKSGDVEFVRRSMEARALLMRGMTEGAATIDRAEIEFRTLVGERPDDARARAGLAIALVARSYASPALRSMLAEKALGEARIARRLDPTQPESYSVEADVACMRDDWETCMALSEKARGLAPSNQFVVQMSAYPLAHLGYLERAESVVRELVARDPLAGDVHFLHARLLDTRGLHDDAREELAKTGSGAPYARWFNAVWRGDTVEALRIAETDIAAGGASTLAPGFAATARALADPARWPEARAAFAESERAGMPWNLLRALDPESASDPDRLIRGIDGLRKHGLSSWQFLLWSRELAVLRRQPAFQDYLRDSGILAYWRQHGLPPQCREAAAGIACD